MQEELLKIINHYGVDNQLKKINEEVFELIEAIRNYEDDYIKVDCDEKAVLPFFKKHIEEELADVMVLLNQFNEYYSLNLDNVENIIQQKINRQLERMKEGKEENE